MKKGQPMRRSKPLRSGTATLMRMKPLEMIDRAKTVGDIKAAMYVSAAQSHERKRRKALRRVGSRAARDRDELRAACAVALERSRGRCEWCGAKAALDVHHIVPRSRGVGWPRLHAPGSLAAICRFPCHERATADPLSILDARSELGTRAEMVWQKFNAWRRGG